jgi:hypothetical protein
LNTGSVRSPSASLPSRADTPPYVAGGDHQQTEADDLVEGVHDASRVARVRQTGGQAPGHVEAALHLA